MGEWRDYDDWEESRAADRVDHDHLYGQERPMSRVHAAALLEIDDALTMLHQDVAFMKHAPAPIRNEYLRQLRALVEAVAA